MRPRVQSVCRERSELPKLAGTLGTVGAWRISRLRTGPLRKPWFCWAWAPHLLSLATQGRGHQVTAAKMLL